MKTTHYDPIREFQNKRREAVALYGQNVDWKKTSRQWLEEAFRQEYMYNFSWLGRPIIQLPADMIAFQEIVWSVQPDLIIETGIAHGGSLILSASMLAVLDYCDAIKSREMLDPSKPKRRVVGVDIDIRAHNRKAIEDHPLSASIDMIEGSSLAPNIKKRVYDAAHGVSRILVCLDSNHTHEHVLEELELYAPLVSKGSYCIVFDTLIEDLPDSAFPDRPWSSGNSPKTAVHAYLEKLKSKEHRAADGRELSFELDTTIEEKLLLNATPDGFLRRT